MLIQRFDPFKEFEELRKSFEQMSRVMNSLEEGRIEKDLAFIPAVNTREGDDAYYIEVDLPGVKKEDINIDVHDNILTVNGERKLEEERKDDEFYRVESLYGKFERSFTLPEDVDSDKIEAKDENGVLLITIPKAQQVDKAPKKIEIK